MKPSNYRWKTHKENPKRSQNNGDMECLIKRCWRFFGK